MKAMQVIFKIFCSHVKGVKTKGEINFNNIFHLTQHIQVLLFWHVIKTKKSRHFTFFFLVLSL